MLLFRREVVGLDKKVEDYRASLLIYQYKTFVDVTY